MSRTLSGFGEPSAQLREKLYDRARITIRKQLEARNPPLDETSFNAELAKLDDAIYDIELSYGGEARAGEALDEPGFAQTQPSQAQPAQSPPAEVPPAPLPLPQTSTSEPQAVAEPIAPASFEPTAQSSFEPGVGSEVESAPISDNTAFDPAAFDAPRNDGIADPVSDDLTVPDRSEELQLPQAPNATVAATAASQTSDPIADAIADFAKSDSVAPLEPIHADPNIIPHDEIGERSIEASVENPEATAYFEQAFEEQSTLGDLPDFGQEPAEVAQIDPALAPIEADVHGTMPRIDDFPEIDFNQPGHDESLIIPPAPGLEPIEEERERGGFGKWIAIILILVLLAALAIAAWLYRQPVMDMIGLGDDDALKPRPVQTITISPPTAEEQDQEDTPVPQSSEPVPKVEERLTEDGDTTTPEPIVPDQSTAGEEAQSGTDGGGIDAPSPAATGSASAILYEEGATNDSGLQVDGSVRWSVVQEAPATGEPEEPAIRAQVEIPERQMVLIATIKRNSDPALTASHLIELIFATPADFSGGVVDSVNRFVMKQSEESRGDSLSGVPVEITDGHFWIALDNSQANRDRNVELLKSRDWIDIPMQYRTGRRALITLDKGDDGKRVFDEVFAAWGS